MPLFVGMIIEMGYEWILAVFISFSFLFFPSLNVLFMFSPSLKEDLLTDDTVWSIWFIYLFELAVLYIFYDLMLGDFAQYFEIPTSFWTDVFIWIQIVSMSIELVLFLAYLLSATVDADLTFIGFLND